MTEQTGGKKRMAKLTKAERSALARKAAEARWVAKKKGVRYVSRIPKAVPTGLVLVHNHIRPADFHPTYPLGLHGFRAWLEDPDPKYLQVCPCGWAPKLDQHFRVIFRAKKRGK
jgi:hypothetical protein